MQSDEAGAYSLPRHGIAYRISPAARNAFSITLPTLSRRGLALFLRSGFALFVRAAQMIGSRRPRAARGGVAAASPLGASPHDAAM